MNREAATALLDTIVREIGRTELLALLQAAALWGVLGAVLGFALSFGAYRLFRRLRWYHAVSPSGRWLQRGLFAVVTLVSIVLLGAAGLWEGVHRQCHHTLTRSHLGTDVLPPVADLLADACAWVDLAVQRGGLPTPAALDARLAAFRAGRWELDARKFLQLADSLQEGAFRDLLGRLEQDLLRKSPRLKGGLTEKLLHQAIHGLGPALLENQLSDELRRRGLEHLQESLRTGLVAEAARVGDPATIGYRDLSRLILREGLLPAIEQPVRKFARQQQLLCGVTAVLACLLPAAVFRLCRRKPAPVAAGPAATATPGGG